MLVQEEEKSVEEFEDIYVSGTSLNSEKEESYNQIKRIINSWKSMWVNNFNVNNIIIVVTKGNGIRKCWGDGGRGRSLGFN